MKVVIKRVSKTIGHVEKQDVLVTKLENVSRLEAGVEYDSDVLRYDLETGSEYKTDVLRIDLKIGEESFQERFSLDEDIAFSYSHTYSYSQKGSTIKGSVARDRDSFIEYFYKLIDSSELTIERRSLYKNYEPLMNVTTVLREYEVTFTNSDGMILTITDVC